MAVTITTLQRRGLYCLRVSGVSGSLELLRWTFATEDEPASVTSAASLPDELLSFIKRNLDRLALAVSADDLQDQQALLALVCTVRDGRGEAVASALAGEGYLALEVDDLDGDVVHYLFVGIPHSMEHPLC